MKSARLVTTFLAIASVSVSCGSQESAIDDAGVPIQTQVDAGKVPAVNVSLEVRPSQSQNSQVAATSANGLEGFVSSATSPLPKFQTHNARHTLKDVEGAPKSSLNLSLRSTTKTGRENPFALAEQPDFEVRFLTAKASNSLPPVPNIGLGPEPGASLLPVSPEAAPIELLPAVPTVIAPPELLDTASIAPNPPQLVVPPAMGGAPVDSPSSSILPQVASPTALAEAVEIKGVVQLGDQIAVIVNEGEGRLSRTVQPGARLAGGQVELRRIETMTAEPRVVLVQNGVEIVRKIGV